MAKPPGAPKWHVNEATYARSVLMAVDAPKMLTRLLTMLRELKGAGTASR